MSILPVFTIVTMFHRMVELYENGYEHSHISTAEIEGDALLYIELLFELMWNTNPDEIVFEPDNYEEVSMAIGDATDDSKKKALAIVCGLDG